MQGIRNVEKLNSLLGYIIFSIKTVSLNLNSDYCSKSSNQNFQIYVIYDECMLISIDSQN